MAANGDESEAKNGGPDERRERGLLRADWLRFIGDVDASGVSRGVVLGPGEAALVLEELRKARGQVERLRALLARVGLSLDEIADLRPTLDGRGRAAVDVGVIDADGLARLLDWLERMGNARG